MSVKIRLRRMGAKNRPFYRVVVADSRCSNTGRFIETIGYYDPMKPAGDCVLKLERLEHWKSEGAQVSGNVKALVKRAIPYEKTMAPADADTAAVLEAAPVAEAPAPASAPVADETPAAE